MDLDDSVENALTILKPKKSDIASIIPYQGLSENVNVSFDDMDLISPLPLQDSQDAIGSMEHQIDANDYISELIKECEKLLAVNRNKEVGMSAFVTIILNSVGRLGIEEVSKIQTEILRWKIHHSEDFLALLQQVQFILCFRLARSKSRWENHVSYLNDMLLAFGLDPSLFHFSHFKACNNLRSTQVSLLGIENTLASYSYEEDYKPLTARDITKFTTLAAAGDSLATAVLAGNLKREKTKFNVSAVFFNAEKQLQLLAKDTGFLMKILEGCLPTRKLKVDIDGCRRSLDLDPLFDTSCTGEVDNMIDVYQITSIIGGDAAEMFKRALDRFQEHWTVVLLQLLNLKKDMINSESYTILLTLYNENDKCVSALENFFYKSWGSLKHLCDTGCYVLVKNGEGIDIILQLNMLENFIHLDMMLAKVLLGQSSWNDDYLMWSYLRQVHLEAIATAGLKALRKCNIPKNLGEPIFANASSMEQSTSSSAGKHKYLRGSKYK